MIRTSGEMRVSNYLLWQIAYSEIYVTDTLWPDFRRCHLLEAVLAYQKRERRYGGISGTPEVDRRQVRPCSAVGVGRTHMVRLAERRRHGRRGAGRASSGCRRPPSASAVSAAGRCRGLRVRAAGWTSGRASADG